MEYELKKPAQQVKKALDAINTKSVVYFSQTDPLAIKAREQLKRFTKLIYEKGSSDPLKPSAGLQRNLATLSENPIFLCGVHKSGTTLLRNLLDNHPDILVLPTDGRGYRWINTQRSNKKEECLEHIITWTLSSLISPIKGVAPMWILGHDIEPYLRFVRYYSFWQKSLPNTVKGTMLTIVSALYSVMCPTLLSSTKKYWAEKSTYNIEDAEILLELFPQARFIHIVRHPCAVIAAQKRKQPLKGRRFKILQELEILNNGMRLGKENLERYGKEIYKIIRYEDLVNNTQGTMRRIASFLDIPFHDIMTRPTVNALAAGSNTAHEEKTPDVGTVTNVVTDYWREYLTKMEIQLISSYLQSLLHYYKYDRENSSFFRYLLSLIILKGQYTNNPSLQDISIEQGIERWFKKEIGHAYQHILFWKRNSKNI